MITSKTKGALYISSILLIIWLAKLIGSLHISNNASFIVATAIVVFGVVLVFRKKFLETFNYSRAASLFLYGMLISFVFASVLAIISGK
jgi:hypothetical protein